MHEYRGILQPGAALKIGIIVSRFNELVTKNLLAGAQDCLYQHGVNSENVDVAWVPGAFEIPIVAQRMARSGQYDALICLGAVIRGATSHFDYVASGVTSGVQRVAMECDLPVTFGVLTTDTLEQALERAGSKAGNKGYEATSAALDLLSVLQQLGCEAPTAATAKGR